MGGMLVRHEPTSAALVRQELSADLVRAGVSADSIDEAVLVVSELVGNAVRHTPTTDVDGLSVDWQVEPDGLTLRVADPSSVMPAPRDVGPAATSGRGLMIVAAICSAWGVEPVGSGKQVWATIPLSLQDSSAS